MKTALKCLDRNPVLFALILLACVPATNASIQPISLPDTSFAAPAGGDGSSGVPIVSADGRYVLFASTANNLVLTNNNNAVLPQRMNVYLRDGVNGRTALVSANLAGTGGGNADSFPAGISTNGQFVLFESEASDLIANGTNGVSDVFRRNLVDGTMALVAVSTNGGDANGPSYNSVMTPDGRYVAFTSAASNLVAGDTNGIPDVFVRDLQANTTMLVSVGAQTTNFLESMTSFSDSPDVTPDGRYVAFYSTATNLVSGITNSGEIYIRDLQTGQTSWGSTNGRALFQSVTGSFNAACCNFRISDDGRFIAYEVCTNGPTGAPASGIILRYNLQTGLTDMISTNAYVPDLPPGDIGDLAMTPDGRFVAFVANIGNKAGTNTAVYLWDAQTGSNAIVSADLNNPAIAANGISDSPMISSNGQWIAFISSATDLTTNSLTGDYHVYLRNRQTGAVQVLDAATEGSGAGVNPIAAPALSDDGSVVAFESANMLNDNRHLVYDVFAYDTGSESAALVSAHDPALAAQSPNGIGGLTSFSVSSNGQFVAFDSDADDLVSGDTNETRDVFVRDLAAGTNILVSVNTNGVPGDGFSSDEAISGDGRYVAFTSLADDLAPGDDNHAPDVFVRDLQAGTTTIVSVSTDGVTPGNNDSYSPNISADGRCVLFQSQASNLAAGVGGGNLFLRDLQSATTYGLTVSGLEGASMTPDGRLIAFIGTAPFTSGTALYVWDSQLAALVHTNSVTVNVYSSFPMISISPDGQKVAFLSGSPVSLSVADLMAGTVTTVSSNGTYLTHAGLQFSGDSRFLTYAVQTSSNATQNVYRYDVQAGTNLLLSENFNFTGAANGNSDSPVISADGRYVTFRSPASDIVPGDSNSVPDLFIYDVSNNATILVSVNGSGNSTANDRSLNPVFSADSRTLVFQSWASDLAANDFNNSCDIYALDLTALPIITSGGGGSTNSGPAFCAQLLPTGSFGQNPTVSWPLASGKTYQVQYKDNLNDPVWQNLPGDITFIGSNGHLTDPSPPSNRRFYRVLLNP